MVPTRASAPTSFDESFSYFVPSLWGGEHTFKMGGGISFNQMPPRTTVDSGTFQFRSDAPYNPADPATYPFQFDVIVGPPDVDGYDVFSQGPPLLLLRSRTSGASANNVTLNLGLRYDNQRQTPDAQHDVRAARRLCLGRHRHRQDGRARRRRQVLRLPAGGARPDAAAEQRADAVPDASRSTTANDRRRRPRPDVITDSAGNPGVAASERRPARRS